MVQNMTAEKSHKIIIRCIEKILSFQHVHIEVMQKNINHVWLFVCNIKRFIDKMEGSISGTKNCDLT